MSAFTSREYLTTEQYVDDSRFAARQDLWNYRVPLVDRYAWAIDHAALDGDETVVDVGCGNGRYLAELSRRGHAGQLVGVDLSPGMVLAARPGALGAGFAAGDAMALPVADTSVDVAFAMHMLYHVPDQSAAVRELRRVVRAGGRAIVSTNSVEGNAQIDDVLVATLEALGGRDIGRLHSAIPFSLEKGDAVLTKAFDSVERHDLVGEVVVTTPDPVVAYLGSLAAWGDEVLDGVRRRVQAVIDADGAFRATSHSGLFICS